MDDAPALHMNFRARVRLGPMRAVDFCVDARPAPCRRIRNNDRAPRGLRTLDALRDLPLAVVSNAPWAQQRDKLARFGLVERFVAIVTPDTAGVGKPDAAIFQAACTALRVTPTECLHIGDHREHDARGACAAGLRGIWLDRTGLGTEGIERVTGLDGLIGMIRARKAAGSSE